MLKFLGSCKLPALGLILIHSQDALETEASTESSPGEGPILHSSRGFWQGTVMKTLLQRRPELLTDY